MEKNQRLYNMVEHRLKIREAIHYLENNGFKVVVCNDPPLSPVPFLAKKEWHINEIKTGCACDHCRKIRIDRMNQWGDIKESWWKGVFKNVPHRKKS